MPPTPTTDPLSPDQINDRYWNSEQTVDEITGDLEIGRSTLYAAVRPVPAGVSCPACGERMVYTNRTNRSNEMATCRVCGTETHASAAAAPRPAADFGDPTAADGDGEGGLARWRRDFASVEPERYALVGGAAALGVVLGAAATRAIRAML